MFPRVSPKKSWEGLFGGMACTIGAAFILNRFGWFDTITKEGFELLIAGAFGMIVSVFGTLGDLVESLMKRTVGVKDSGKFLPGHGGVLDRFDSTLLAAPTALLFVLMMITVKTKLSWQKNFLILLPASIAVPFYFSSQWTHLVCYFHETNTWAPGPLRYLPYAIFALYLVLFLVRNIVFLQSETSQIRGILYFIIFAPVVGVLLYLITSYSDDYSALFTSSIVLYYLFIYLHFARFDPLTGLLNRQVYYFDMNSGSGRITYAVSIDLNDLKLINDSYGHDAGDAALKTVAAVLKKNVGRNGTLYRIGGDEFVIFYHGVDEGAVVQAIEKMRGEMAKTPYVCAFGYAKRGPLHTVEDAVRYADHEMYDDKAQIKKFQEAERRAGRPGNKTV